MWYIHYMYTHVHTRRDIYIHIYVIYMCIYGTIRYRIFISPEISPIPVCSWFLLHSHPPAQETTVLIPGSDFWNPMNGIIYYTLF